VASLDQLLENHLYTVRDVIAGRVDTNTDDGRATISVVVAPEADIDVISKQLLDVLTPRLNDAAQSIDLKITQLGNADDSVTVRAERDPHATSAVSAPVASGAVAERANRIALEGVIGAVHDGRFTAQVELRTPDGTVTAGTASASAVSSALPRAVADATIAAVGQVASIDACFIEIAEIVRRGDRSVAVVVLVLGDDGPDEVVSGSAVVNGSGTTDAVARAVLHALNRRMKIVA
jgi:hypothetical protein